MEMTTLYTLLQNGVTEHLNHTIVKHSHTIIYNIGLPYFFQPEIVSTFIYLKNLGPTITLNSKDIILSQNVSHLLCFFFFAFYNLFRSYKKFDGGLTYSDKGVQCLVYITSILVLNLRKNITYTIISEFLYLHNKPLE